MRQFVFKDIRVQLLGDSVLRIEKAKDGRFCDAQTLFIPEREKISGEEPAATQTGNIISFGDYILTFTTDSKLDGVLLTHCGVDIYRYKKKANSGELPRPIDTPEAFAIFDSPRILVPEHGYTVLSGDCRYIIEEDAEDFYILLCGGDHEKLRRLYVELTGGPELVRLSTLGSWNSKYYPYTEQQAIQLIEDYRKHNVPLDVMVIDTDWRSCENGWGYDINTELFPDMARFFGKAHKRGVEIMFNDHPEPLNNAHVFDSAEIEYRESNLTRLHEMGLDMWWYDRNWTTHLNTPTNGINWETLGMYLFTEITKHHYQRLGGDEKIYRRPVIMGNVNNILNGTYEGIYDSASHRFSIQWTGDTMSDLSALSQEIANIIKTGENCIGYSHPDCGGHQGNPDKELFVRWMQLGVFCPILRPHCSNNVERYREPWAYDGETLDIVRDYIKLRYRLLPVIYAEAYKNHKLGAPIFASLGYNYPSDREAADCRSEYMLGRNILLAYSTDEYPDALSADCYTAPVNVDFFDGRECAGDIIASAEWERVNMYLCHTSPEKNVPLYDFSARIKTKIKLDNSGELILRCDDGATLWLDGEKLLEDNGLHSAKNFSLGVFEAGEEHTIDIKYYQAGGEAACQLLIKPLKESSFNDVYFPSGRWIDAFDGSIYSKESGRTTECPLREMPMFLRLGSIIPVAEDALNTREQSWQRLTYHYFPDREASDCGFVYEDDRETTAYKYGCRRISEYSAAYDSSLGAYTVKLSAAVGDFDGDGIESRDVTLAVHKHSLAGDISRITLNGENVAFTLKKADSSAMPLTFDGRSPDSDVITVSFTSQTDSEYVICIYSD